MNFNGKEQLSFYEVFEGQPKDVSFVWKKGANCNELLKHLPVSWNRTQE